LNNENRTRARSIRTVAECGRGGEVMSDLSVTYAGVEFKNPIVAAAGPLGRTFHALKSSIEAGVAAVTLKSANADPGPYAGTKPAAHVYPRPAHRFLKKHGLPTVMINWEGVPVDFTAVKQAEMIRKIRPIARDHGAKIIANIHPDPMYLEDEGMFRRDIQILMDAEPDLLEACPCPYHLPPEVTYPDNPVTKEMQDFALKTWGVPLRQANVPYIAKASFHLFRYANETFRDVGIENLHVTEGPWFYGTVVDIDSMRPLVPGPGVITYGSLRKPIMNNHVARTVALGDFQIMSSGGVWNAQDAIERMMCGARLVGIHTAIQYHGHKLFPKIIKGISNFLDKKNLPAEAIIGAAQPEIVSQAAHDAFMRQVDRPADSIRPVIDEDKCKHCGTCSNCIHGAIVMRERQPQLDLELCVRCGVCESLCRTGALTMECA
jgi:dihydropyrimidine dehydrogenase (NAD+) subunit PreA